MKTIVRIKWIKIFLKIPNTTSYISTWSNYLKVIMNDSNIKKTLGKLNITIGDIDEKYGDDTEGYITKLFEIDEMCIDNPRLAEQKLNTKLDKFPQKIRLKLRQLRVLKALIKAKQNKKMDQFIMKHIIYAKQNISYGDLMDFLESFLIVCYNTGR